MERTIPLLRNPLWEKLPQNPHEEKLEAVRLANISAVMRQLGQLSCQTSDIFREIQSEVDVVAARTSKLCQRLDHLYRRFGEEFELLPSTSPVICEKVEVADFERKQASHKEAVKASGFLDAGPEPAAVAASLELCRALPLRSSGSLQDTEEAASSSAGQSQSGGQAQRLRHQPLPARRFPAGRYGFPSINHGTGQGPTSKQRDGGVGMSSDLPDSPDLPVAQPGGESPTIGRRDRQSPFQADPAEDSPTDAASCGGSLEDEAEEAFYSPPSAPASREPSISDADVAEPQACTSPTLKREAAAAEEPSLEGYKIHPSNPFLPAPPAQASTPPGLPGRSRDAVQPGASSEGSGNESPGRSSTACSELTLANSNAGDVPPPISCASPKQRAGRGRSVPTEAQGPAHTDGDGEGSGPSPSSKPEGGGGVRRADRKPNPKPPPPPPPPPGSTRPAASGPGQEAAAAGGRPFSASDLIASRSALRGRGKETAQQPRESSAAAPATFASAVSGLSFSAADLQQGRAKLKSIEAQAEGVGKQPPQASSAADPHSKMLEQIRSGNVQLRRTAATPPQGGPRSPGPSSATGTPPGDSHMAALLDRVQTIRMMTQENDGDSDESWDDE